jgi:hypothetical protein
MATIALPPFASASRTICSMTWLRLSASACVTRAS